MLEHDEYIVILSLWKRSEWLREQVEIFRSQTVPPKEIWLTYGLNEQNIHLIKSDLMLLFDKIIILEDGGSVFSRFEFAKESNEELFLIIDDDMFPTPNYMEQCLDFFRKNKDCIIASSGRVFKGEEYFPNNMYGSVKYSKSTEIDIGTNGWFLSRQSIECLMDNHNRKNYNNCEDIALSYLNRKLRNVKTYVIEQSHLCNSDKYQHTRGVGEEALSHASKHSSFYKQRNEVLNFYKNYGLKNE